MKKCIVCGKDCSRLYCSRHCAHLRHYKEDGHYKERKRFYSLKQYNKLKDTPRFKAYSKEKLRKWVEENREHHNTYMRNYMREYNQKKRDKKNQCPQETKLEQLETATTETRPVDNI
jgi:hypothetical protein